MRRFSFSEHWVLARAVLIGLAMSIQIEPAHSFFSGFSDPIDLLEERSPSSFTKGVIICSQPPYVERLSTAAFCVFDGSIIDAIFNDRICFWPLTWGYQNTCLSTRGKFEFVIHWQRNRKNFCHDPVSKLVRWRVAGIKENGRGGESIIRVLISCGANRDSDIRSQLHLAELLLPSGNLLVYADALDYLICVDLERP